MNTTPRIFVAVALAALLAVGCTSPEKAMAGHAEAITGIVEKNIDTPKEGIVQLREYWRANFPEVAETLAKAVVELDRLEGAKRVERVTEWVAAVQTPLKALTAAMERFGKKVEGDKDARAALEEIGGSYMDLAKIVSLSD